ncbi:carbonic anhydrase [Lanmaoa asiatica]|nr:carbonic anhydrase [Lanmaoa asiatica]
MIPPRSPVHILLDGNAKWAHAVDRAEPGFFRKSALGQQPKVLWIGCADSRVPESVLTGARPGDIFVHRNIANQFHTDDDSALAVLAYAIGVVGVEHVVIAGHTHCGGAAACYHAVSARSTSISQDTAPMDAPAAAAAAALTTTTETPLSRWLTPLIDLIASLDLSNTTPATALDLIVQENVKRQVEHVCAADPIKQAWQAGKHVWVHGWVYDVASGRIKDLGVSRGPGISA